MREYEKDLAFKQYMVLARIKGSATEILNTANAGMEILGQTPKTNQIVADRLFELMLAFSNVISEIIKEYLATQRNLKG